MKSYKHSPPPPATYYRDPFTEIKCVRFACVLTCTYACRPDHNPSTVNAQQVSSTNVSVFPGLNWPFENVQEKIYKNKTKPL